MNNKIVILILFIIIVSLAKIYDLDNYFTFENLKTQKNILENFILNNYVLTIVLFILLYITCVTFLVPVATVLTLSGGFLFGPLWGTLFVNIGATIGAVFSFLFARYILGANIQSKYKKELTKFNYELESNKYQYLFSLRFLPIFPFFLINFLCGVTSLDLKSFFITTSLGIIPGSFVYTYAGSRLSQINTLNDIFTKEILFAFILLGMLSLLPVIIKKVRKNNESTTA